MNALGLIEVDGYLTGIVAADAALKAASVKLLGLERVKSGITCVEITGDIGAVKASVEAGEYEAKKIGFLRSSLVIPKLDEQTSQVLFNQNVSSQLSPTQEESVIESKTDIIDEDINIKKVESDNDLLIVDVEANNTEKNQSTNNKEKIDYHNMKVDQLRNLIKRLKISNLTKEQLKLLKKEELINILDKYYKDLEEGDK